MNVAQERNPHVGHVQTQRSRSSYAALSPALQVTPMFLVLFRVTVFVNPFGDTNEDEVCNPKRGRVSQHDSFAQDGEDDVHFEEDHSRPNSNKLMRCSATSCKDIGFHVETCIAAVTTIQLCSVDEVSHRNQKCLLPVCDR